MKQNQCTVYYCQSPVMLEEAKQMLASHSISTLTVYSNLISSAKL